MDALKGNKSGGIYRTETQTASAPVGRSYDRAAVGVRGHVLPSVYFFFFNRAAEGGRGSRIAFGFLTAQPKAGVVLDLLVVF